VIEVDDNGYMTVTGPIEDKMTCYGMLALARDIIKEHEKSKVEIIDKNGEVIIDNQSVQ